MPDDPLRDAHTALRQAIADLKAIGVPVPMSLYMAVHALSYVPSETTAPCCRSSPNRSSRIRIAIV